MGSFGEYYLTFSPSCGSPSLIAFENTPRYLHICGSAVQSVPVSPSLPREHLLSPTLVLVSCSPSGATPKSAGGTLLCSTCLPLSQYVSCNSNAPLRRILRCLQTSYYSHAAALLPLTYIRTLNRATLRILRPPKSLPIKSGRFMAVSGDKTSSAAQVA